MLALDLLAMDLVAAFLVLAADLDFDFAFDLDLADLDLVRLALAARDLVFLADLVVFRAAMDTSSAMNGNMNDGRHIAWRCRR
ncbi:hypothetical protein AYJ54_09470 [Bradyrhizobium centrolobii]|uniref:Uncharacterized protein n=1 Tax=Bradyrhizobium centrolobii TaxID=1505087 RepID=A0A176YTF3_9BRAD|nr:hypothetical protein AYJ54_09470 [Bradyrhizobium centrolobii]